MQWNYRCLLERCFCLMVLRLAVMRAMISEMSLLKFSP